MPAKLDRCVNDVMAKGKSKSSAFAICNSALYKRAISDRYIEEKGGLSKVKKDLIITQGLDDYAREKVAENIEVPKERINRPTHDDIKTSMTKSEYEDYKNQLKRRESAFSNRSKIEELKVKNSNMRHRLKEYGTRKNLKASEKFKIKAGKTLKNIGKGLSGLLSHSPKKSLVPALARVVR